MQSEEEVPRCEGPPMVIFHQQMAEEKASWGGESAKEMARMGYVVIGIRTPHWRKLIESSPESFRNPFDKQDQSMICVINLRDLVLPMLRRVIQASRLPADPRQWSTLPLFECVDIYVDDTTTRTPDFKLVGITEASSKVVSGPDDLRGIYGADST